MKGKLDNNGNLLLYKNNHYKIQKCPYSSHLSFCGDWCPLMSEDGAAKLGFKMLILCDQRTVELVEDCRR